VGAAIFFIFAFPESAFFELYLSLFASDRGFDRSFKLTYRFYLVFISKICGTIYSAKVSYRTASIAIILYRQSTFLKKAVTFEANSC
jgi:hypothetical protein